MSELWAALQDGSLSSLEGMKVASYLWKQESVRKIGKWRLLLKWTLDEVCKAYNRKAKSHPQNEVRCQLWQLLSVMLESMSTSDVELWVGETSPNAYFFQVLSVEPCFSSTPMIHTQHGDCTLCMY